MKTRPESHLRGALNEELLSRLVQNEKMAELGRMSAGIVHELNAPLSVITSAAQMILREADIPESVREMVARISSEAHRLSHLTRGLLNFSSHEEAIAEADVNITAEFVLDFLGYEAARRGVVLHRKLDYQLPLIQMDPNLLKQVLLNIVMNGLQAMEEQGGGELTLESRAADAEEVCMTITDTGPGIPEELLARIFEPYVTTKKPGQGTGLGLYVTRSLMESQRGRITVQSWPDQGTEFTLYFPVLTD